MRFAALAALSVLVVLPADALQQRQYASLTPNASLTPTCDNDGRCTTLSATVPSRATHDNLPEIKTTAPIPAARPQLRPLDANGNITGGLVISRKTGARAHVGVAYAARFQAYIDDIENNHGARVLFMGGIRPGRCLPSSEHPCGKALDVCQLRRGVVDRRCNLPDRVALGRIAASHGLFEGGRWCNSDYGHAQIDVTAAACNERGVRIVQQRHLEETTGFQQNMALGALH
jgi:hypothetical protein